MTAPPAQLDELENALARRTRELEALNDIALEINSQPNLSALLHAIVKRATALVGVRAGGVYLMQPDGHTLELVVADNLMDDYVGVRLKLGEGLSGRVAQAKQVMSVPDYANWPGRADVYHDSPFRRVLAVPMQTRDQTHRRPHLDRR